RTFSESFGEPILNTVEDDTRLEFGAISVPSLGILLNSLFSWPEGEGAARDVVIPGSVCARDGSLSEHDQPREAAYSLPAALDFRCAVSSLKCIDVGIGEATAIIGDLDARNGLDRSRSTNSG